jgi:hypothetical protein
MKAKLPNSKILKFIGGCAALTMLAGCIVMSVYPFYNDQDLTADPGLAGQWANTTSTNETWQFTSSGPKSYTLTTIDSASTNTFSAHLFQLKKYQFMDFLTTNRDMYVMPMHLIAKAERNGTNLSMHFLDYGWLTGLLETNPAVLRHIVVPANPDDTNNDNMLYLTAGTSDLQKFLLKHAEDTNAFTADSDKELQKTQ